MTDTSRHSLLPVIIGGDTGVYGIGRSFHEAYGCRCIVVASAPTEAIKRSVFFDVETIPPRIGDEELLAVLIGIASAHPGRERVLMANHDLFSSFIARNYEVLAAHYALPFPTADVVDAVTDKASFARICSELNIATPGTLEVDFSQATLSQWQAPEIPFDFPVVAKAARGDAYDSLTFEGKRKIWFIESATELESLWQTLIGAGFADTFLVQELIPGDNTYMRSITAYVDSRGEMTLIGSARVLLEDHDPTLIGNPVAMVTEPFEELWEDARRILEATDYRGFANFDIKIDPRNGRALFFEVNPRIGRNNWYMTAARANPMTVMVEDLIDAKECPRLEARAEVLYTLVPNSLLLRYIRDDALRTRVEKIIARGDAFSPLEYQVESDLKRRVIIALQKLNQHRKFARYYPEPTDQSF